MTEAEGCVVGGERRAGRGVAWRGVAGQQKVGRGERPLAAGFEDREKDQEQREAGSL